MTTRVTAASASPLSSPNPNFESSVPVSMNSCVCASTPGVTRTWSAGDRGTGCRETVDAIELVERVDDDAADPVLAPRAAARRRTCCCRGTRRAPSGTRRAARRAARRRSRRRARGPPRRRGGPSPCRGTPCSRTQRPRRTPAWYSRHRRAELGLVVDVQRCAEPLGQLGEVDARRARRDPPSTDAARGKQRRGRTARLTRRVVGVVVDARHLVGRVHAEQAERVREPDAARLGQPQPRLGELRSSVGEHPAVAVEAVERAREVAHPGRDLLRRARLGRVGDDFRIQRERAQQLLFAFVREPREIDRLDRPACDTLPPRPSVRSTRCARARTARSRRGSPSTAR